MEFDEVAADELGVVTGAAMLKDETAASVADCARCAVPVGTITMESYNLIPAEPTGLISIASIGAGTTEIGTRQAMADETKKNDDVNRRQFFMKLGLGSLSIAAAGTAAFAYQYLEPNVLFEPSPVVNAGKPDRYPLGFGHARCEFGHLHHPFAGRLSSR